MKHQRKQLRPVSDKRHVGFADAVADLGTHLVHGRAVPYSRQMIYGVLQGKMQSRRLLRIIANKRPDLFALRFVHPDVATWFRSWQMFDAHAEKKPANKITIKTEVFQ